MRKLVRLFVVLAGFYAPLVMSAETKIEIISPENGARLQNTKPNTLEYRINVAGGNFGHRDRMYVYLDDQKLGKLYQLSGQYPLEKLPLGKHEICIRVISEAAAPAELQQCVTVSIFGFRGMPR